MKRLIAFIVYFPHILLYCSSKSKKIIELDLYNGKIKQESSVKTISDLSLKLMGNRYFRTLFYFRTHGFFSKILRVFYPKERSFIIDRFSKIGSGLQLVHPYSTIINCEIMGKNCYINHLVTIGEKNGKKPIIGDEVELHTNCSIIGGIVIGNNAVIGAGAVVVKDVPPNAIVAGNPAAILKYRNQ